MVAFSVGEGGWRVLKSRDGMVGGDGGLGLVDKAAVMADKNAARSSWARPWRLAMKALALAPLAAALLALLADMVVAKEAVEAV